MTLCPGNFPRGIHPLGTIKESIPYEAANAAFYNRPAPLWALATTGDSRGAKVLRKGLSSSNYLVVAAAARGLALIGDKESVQLIIDTCMRLGPSPAAVVARALVFFEGPDAEAAAERFIRNLEMLEGLREGKARLGLKALF